MTPAAGGDGVVVVDSVGAGEDAALVLSTVTGSGTTTRRIRTPDALFDLTAWTTPTAIRMIGVPCPAEDVAQLPPNAEDEERLLCRRGYRLYEIPADSDKLVELSTLPAASNSVRVAAPDADGRSMLFPEGESPLLVQGDGTTRSLTMPTPIPGPTASVSGAFCRRGGDDVAVVASSTGPAVSASNEAERGTTEFRYFDPATGASSGSATGPFAATDIACADGEAFVRTAFRSYPVDLTPSAVTVGEKINATFFPSSNGLVWIEPPAGDQAVIRSTDATRTWTTGSADAPWNLVASGDLLVGQWGSGGAMTKVEITNR